MFICNKTTADFIAGKKGTRKVEKVAKTNPTKKMFTYSEEHKGNNLDVRA